mmetsp:Transcript_61605/g.156583  ORF Transcript_61605/g.156583 Transcript_61605/m.156583 type:complete len:270 (-) Transcript_61605:77-886(-)
MDAAVTASGGRTALLETEADLQCEFEMPISSSAWLQAMVGCLSCARRPFQVCLDPEQGQQLAPPWACMVAMFFLLFAELCIKLWPKFGLQAVLLPLSAACIVYWLTCQLMSWNLVSFRYRLEVNENTLMREAEMAESMLSNEDVRPPMSPPRQLELQNPLIAERIKQLSERTRICSRRVWEETYLQDLRGKVGAEQMRDSMSSCSICMSNIKMSAQVRGLACGHIFHLPCLAEWFMRDRTFELCCPLCRVPLAKQGIVSDWDGSNSAAQ